MSWSYNQIDVYFLLEDLPLGVTEMTLVDDPIDDENTGKWWPASLFGLVRGRPTLTRSQMNTNNSITIPGLNGTIYNSFSTRGNAKLQFDILVENSWVHNEEDNGSVVNRVDMLQMLMTNAKYISYKMPGVAANTFYLETTLKADCTVTDADKDCSVIQAQIEVVPFKHKFSGNQARYLSEQAWFHYETHHPDGVAKPILLFNTGGSGYLICTTDSRGSNQIICSNVPAGTILDTGKCLAYVEDDELGIVNVNDKFEGDYTNFWFPRNDSIIMSSNGMGNINVYTMEGVDI